MRIFTAYNEHGQMVAVASSFPELKVKAYPYKGELAAYIIKRQDDDDRIHQIEIAFREGEDNAMEWTCLVCGS